MDWKIFFVPGIAALGAGAAQVLMSNFPKHALWGLIAFTLTWIVLASLSKAISPPMSAIVFMSIGSAFLMGGGVYWATNAHWVGDDHYIPNIKLMMQNLSEHARGVVHSSDEDDYLKRQLAAHDCMRSQIVWLNKNMGGDVARDYSVASINITLPNSTKLSGPINKKRSEYYNSIKGKEAFLKNTLLLKNWPQSPKHLVSDPKIC